MGKETQCRQPVMGKGRKKGVPSLYIHPQGAYNSQDIGPGAEWRGRLGTVAKGQGGPRHSRPTFPAPAALGGQGLWGGTGRGSGWTPSCSLLSLQAPAAAPRTPTQPPEKAGRLLQVSSGRPAEPSQGVRGAANTAQAHVTLTHISRNCWNGEALWAVTFPPSAGRQLGSGLRGEDSG